METIFKEEDRVFHYHYGWGTVKSISNSDASEYHVAVSFDLSDRCWFTYDGRELYLEKPSLSFTEYKLEGFSQERPEELPKKGQIVWAREAHKSYWQIGHFFGKEGKMYLLSSGRPDGWSFGGVELRTTNPYANEQ